MSNSAAREKDAATPVIARRSAFIALAVTAALGVPLVVGLGRESAVTVTAVLALAFEVLVLVGLTALERAPGTRFSVLRSMLLVTAALLTVPLGWFFGPNGGITAATSLLVLLTGLLSRRGTSATSWLVFTALCGGELALVLLVVARVLPDLSLAPVLLPGHPDWQYVAAHCATLILNFAGFLAGRALRERYASVQQALDRSVRGAALKGALLEEARLDYRRALRALRKGALSPTGVMRVSFPPEPHVVAKSAGSNDDDSKRPLTETSAALPVTGTTKLWMDAYRTRMRGQRMAVLALCVAGAVILLVMVRSPDALHFALATVIAIACLVVVQREIARRRADESSYWPWVLIGALSIGPAYALGLHSGFACVIAALLFLGGSFRAAPGAPHVGRRVPVLLA